MTLPVRAALSRPTDEGATVDDPVVCGQPEIRRWPAEILGGRQVGVRIEPSTLRFFDLQTRELLRTRVNPLTEAEIRRIRGARKAGPPPRSSAEPIIVQRRASNTGVIIVAGQKVALGRVHKHQTARLQFPSPALHIRWH